MQGKGEQFACWPKRWVHTLSMIHYIRKWQFFLKGLPTEYIDRTWSEGRGKKNGIIWEYFPGNGPPPFGNPCFQKKKKFILHFSSSGAFWVITKYLLFGHYFGIGPRTIWYQDNLAPRTIWHQDNLAPWVKVDNLTPRTIWHRGKFGTMDNLAP